MTQQLQAPAVRVALPAQAQLGEGALWNPLDQRLYWVDIEGQLLHIFDPATGQGRSLPTGARIGTVVPTGQAEEVLVALQTGLHRLNTTTGQLTLLVNPLPDSSLRFNDGKCDPAGRLWVGTLDMQGHPRRAALYRYSPDGHLQTMLTQVSISNGLAWALDQRTMYYVDTPTRTVQAFDYDPATGAITGGRVVIRIPEGHGYPDGITLDAEGQLWIALWGGGRVVRYNPTTGQLLATIAVPAPHTSSCAFGGPGLQTLFITSARQDLSPEQLQEYPLSGNVFAVEPGVAGLPAALFGQASAARR
ncbi:SMP-30/gluconolactonase/LRE family protein [Hymenobacter weizhouensis]|uniref:SMP-30/gluconolactonase/LRE family protein n=1 Tax=Hymenobacter sp. YIM 151500-1 TaxID=2987689 RepID=UPI0022279D41|nr:SMP-30/gluconolactonase/LRE family protein [Hymenobacter sp. YIM 151500-1]UYZ64072.1 SMP-30/gluconolactonase/LRE family protein [Hymenobacter sp. YIM 151500-1]